MPAPFPTATREAAVATYSAGATAEMVSETFGVSSTCILAWVRAAGLEVRPKGRQRTEDAPDAYSGGWALRGGVLRPLRPTRERVDA